MGSPVKPREWEKTLTVKCRLCGGAKCKRCSESAALAKTNSPVLGLHADWVTDRVLGMMRPSSRLMKDYQIAQQFAKCVAPALMTGSVLLALTALLAAPTGCASRQCSTSHSQASTRTAATASLPAASRTTQRPTSCCTIVRCSSGVAVVRTDVCAHSLTRSCEPHQFASTTLAGKT